MLSAQAAPFIISCICPCILSASCHPENIEITISSRERDFFAAGLHTRRWQRSELPLTSFRVCEHGLEAIRKTIITFSLDAWPGCAQLVGCVGFLRDQLESAARWGNGSLKRISRTKIYLLRVAANFFRPPSLSLSLFRSGGAEEREKEIGCNISGARVAWIMFRYYHCRWRNMGAGIRRRRDAPSPLKIQSALSGPQTNFWSPTQIYLRRRGDSAAKGEWAPAVSQKLCDSESLISLFIWQKW